MLPERWSPDSTLTKRHRQKASIGLPSPRGVIHQHSCFYCINITCHMYYWLFYRPPTLRTWARFSYFFPILLPSSHFMIMDNVSLGTVWEIKCCTYYYCLPFSSVVSIVQWAYGMHHIPFSWTPPLHSHAISVLWLRLKSFNSFSTNHALHCINHNLRSFGMLCVWPCYFWTSEYYVATHEPFWLNYLTIFFY